MKKKISWYFERNNLLLGDNVLAICYTADKHQIKYNCLTNENVLVLIKNNKFSKYINSQKFSLEECLVESFGNRKIFIRIQCECLLGIYGDSHCDCEEQKNETLKIIKENEGIYIHLPQEAQGYGLNYKLKELELQVNGRDSSGKFIGCKNRNEAQKAILKNKKFEDKREYKIVVDILKELHLFENEFILITESKKKIRELNKLGLKVEDYTNYIKRHVTLENASEYLAKIYEGTHIYGKNTLIEIIDLLKSGKCNKRTISTFLSIIEKIKKDDINNLSKDDKRMFLNTYKDLEPLF